MNEETHSSAPASEEKVSGPESLMMWLFLAFFVLLAVVIFGDLVGILFD